MRPLRVCIYGGQLCYKRHPPATKLIVVKKIKLNFIDTEKLSKFYFFMVPALVFYVAIVASQSLRQYNDEHL